MKYGASTNHRALRTGFNLRQNKYVYKAYKLAEMGGLEMPTGVSTRFAGSQYGAETLAGQYGFTRYGVSQHAICFLYQSRIRAIKAKPLNLSRLKRLLKLYRFGAIRYIGGKLYGK